MASARILPACRTGRLKISTNALLPGVRLLLRGLSRVSIYLQEVFPLVYK
jgi:hypothetical protein